MASLPERSIEPNEIDNNKLNKDLELADDTLSNLQFIQQEEEKMRAIKKSIKRRRTSSQKSKGSIGTKMTSMKGSRSGSRGRSVVDMTFVPRG